MSATLDAAPIAVVVRLLAPNQRPVRKELSGRYPKYAWPENWLA
jgi:hypothetical protein